MFIILIVCKSTAVIRRILTPNVSMQNSISCPTTCYLPFIPFKGPHNIFYSNYFSKVRWILNLAIFVPLYCLSSQDLLCSALFEFSQFHEHFLNNKCILFPVLLLLFLSAIYPYHKFQIYRLKSNFIWHCIFYIDIEVLLGLQSSYFFFNFYALKHVKYLCPMILLLILFR